MTNKKINVLLSAQKIIKRYQMDKDKSLTVLKGIDLELMQGEIVAVIGHSGAGKSTLLHIMGALDKPSEGEIIINGDAIYDMSKEQLARFRNKTIGFIFQFHYLLPEFNAIENVMMPGLIAGENKKTLYPKAESLLLKVGLKERLRHRPSELSGGEQQRVAFARALVNDPLLILADEPSGNLDSKNSQALHELIWEVVGDKQTTFVVVTHDRKLSNRADRSIILRDGLICENDELI